MRTADLQGHDPYVVLSVSVLNKVNCLHYPLHVYSLVLHVTYQSINTYTEIAPF